MFFCCGEALETIDIQNNKIEVIPVDCFFEMPIPSQIDFKEGVTRIEWNAFFGCYSLKEVSFPDSVSVLGRDIFNKDDDLTVFASSFKLIQYCKDNDVSIIRK